MVEQVKKSGTKPGFKPASRSPLLKAPNGFTARWVRADSSDIERKKAEGWLLMKPEDNKGVAFTAQDVSEEKALGNHIRYRGQVAMMIPDELKEARQEYYKGETSSKLKTGLETMKTGLAGMGGQYRGESPDGKGRIVID